MHEYMTLHAHSNPLLSDSRPKMLLSAAGAVGDYCDKANTGNCPNELPIFSMREVIRYFKKMLKP